MIFFGWASKLSSFLSLLVHGVSDSGFNDSMATGIVHFPAFVGRAAFFAAVEPAPFLTT